MSYIEKPCGEFTELLASGAPIPGGGGASALAGAVGIALGNMVGSLTVGKKKYADVEAHMQTLMTKATSLRIQLLELVDKDAEAFAPLVKAYGMPSQTAEQAAEKQRVMEECLRLACSVPFEIMAKCCEAIELHREFADKGNKVAVSDAGVGAAMCKAALQGAALNVYINTRLMQDKDYAHELNSRADEMLKQYCVAADEILERVYKEIKI